MSVHFRCPMCRQDKPISELYTVGRSASQSDVITVDHAATQERGLVCKSCARKLPMPILDRQTRVEIRDVAPGEVKHDYLITPSEAAVLLRKELHDVETLIHDSTLPQVTTDTKGVPLIRMSDVFIFRNRTKEPEIPEAPDWQDPPPKDDRKGTMTTKRDGTIHSYKDVGALVKADRIRAGLTQRGLMAKTGYTNPSAQSALSILEQTRGSIPVNYIEGIAKTLAWDPELTAQAVKVATKYRASRVSNGKGSAKTEPKTKTKAKAKRKVARKPYVRKPKAPAIPPWQAPTEHEQKLVSAIVDWIAKYEVGPAKGWDGFSELKQLVK